MVAAMTALPQPYGNRGTSVQEVSQGAAKWLFLPLFMFWVGSHWACANNTRQFHSGTNGSSSDMPGAARQTIATVEEEKEEASGGMPPSSFSVALTTIVARG